MTSFAVSLADVRSAAERIAPHVHRTPVMTCATLDRLAGRRLFFKCEHFQRAGAFKFRGATNAVLCLPQAIAVRGVVTHSSGNHAQALALAARRRGIPAHIVMPATAQPVKRRAVEEYGGPYDHPDVIAGQGTAALELLEQVPDLDAILTPVGGGGLLSGVCIAAKGGKPALRIFAGEPAGADDAARSLAAGRLIPQAGPQTIADGLLTSLGELTWPIVRHHVERIITVSEEDIVRAMRLAWERAKLLIEPSSAVAVAAVLTETFKGLSGLERVGVILSGGNVNLDRLPW